MIKLLKELFYFDWLSFKHWYSKETAGKIIIMSIFLIIILGVATISWLFSSSFFNYLSTFESFGRYTSLYIVKATILTILWIGVISSFLSTLTFLLTPDKKIDYLVTLPVDLRIVLVWNGLKTLLLNVILFLVFILPLALAYLQRIESVGFLAGLLRISGLLIFITLISETIGSAMGFIVANRFKKKDGIIFVVFSIILLTGVTVLLFRSILPEQLSLFNSVSPSDFMSLYNSLPLNRLCLMNTYLSEILTVGWGIHVIYLFIVTLVLFIVSAFTQNYLFVDTWQTVRINLNHHLFLFKLRPRSHNSINLVQKDLVSILRSPKELGYAIFLFILLIAFVGLFSRGIEVNRIPGFISPFLLVFSWIWLSFYSITYLMRMCYPLMSKEGKLRWWLFTLPIAPSAILNSKISTGVLTSLPLYLIAILEWIFIPLPKSILFLSVLSIISLFCLSAVITLLGIIKPAFSYADDPEKVSTGLSGILALSISLVISCGSGLLIYFNSVNQISQIAAVNIFVIFSVIFVGGLYMLAHRTLKNHSMELK